MIVDIPDEWQPTAANINALPEPLRRYIMLIETNADPTLTVQQNWLLKDQADALEILVSRCTCSWDRAQRPRLRLVAS